MKSDRFSQLIKFGPFVLDPKRRKLTRGRQDIRIGGRAMDILIELASHQDELVSRETLVAAAWPHTFVHESNLKVTIAYLRRALREHSPGSDYIHTVIGRGYWLGSEATQPDDPDATNQFDPSALPELVTVIGRDAEISIVVQAMRLNRLTTLAGSGGIGKTTVAIAAAHLFEDESDYTIVFVDLARVASGEFVLSTVAAALGITTDGREGIRPIASIIADRKILLLLDTCEHVRDAVAEGCNGLLGATNGLHILATSRQVLAAHDERIIWLAPLEVPPPEQSDTAEHVLRYSAPQLLLARVANTTGYRITDVDAPAVAEICRRLDGAPLAIELVAPRFEGRSPEAVLRELEDRLRTLRKDGPGGPLRQQTLRLTLEWSYALLSHHEAFALRALSVFAGSFKHDEARRILDPIGCSAEQIEQVISGLVAKSMLGREPVADKYRLLDSTRTFAAELLATSAELVPVSREHARLQLETLESVHSRGADLSAMQRRTLCNDRVDDLRKAIDWALRRGGEPLLGINLVAAGLPLWQELSLGAESQQNAEAALAEFDRLGLTDKRLKLTLATGLAMAQAFLSEDPKKTITTFHDAIELARQNSDLDAECTTLGALATYLLLQGKQNLAKETLDAMHTAAVRSDDPFALWEQQHLLSFWIAGEGYLTSAYQQLEQTCSEMQAYAQAHNIESRQELKLRIETNRAGVAWFAGKPGRSQVLVREVLQGATTLGHELTLVYCLAVGMVATLIEMGDFVSATHWSDVLSETVQRHGLAAWVNRAKLYSASVAALSGKDRTPERLRKAYDGLSLGHPQGVHDSYYATLARAMLNAGCIEDAARVVDHQLEIGAQPYILPEFRRIKAATERATGRLDTAEFQLRTALREASSVEAVGIGFRVACDLASLLHERKASSEARELLTPLYNQFTDGFDTLDLRYGRELLKVL